MLHHLDYVRRRAMEAHLKARTSSDSWRRGEWEKAADLWEKIIAQNERLLGIGETLADLSGSPAGRD